MNELEIGSDNTEFQTTIDRLPALFLRDDIIFPCNISAFYVGRNTSIESLDIANALDKTIFLVSQRNGDDENPTFDEVFRVGTISKILQLLKLPDGTRKVLVEGIAAASTHKFENNDYTKALHIEPLKYTFDDLSKLREIHKLLLPIFYKYTKKFNEIPSEVIKSISNSDELSNIIRNVHVFSRYLNESTKVKQYILEEYNIIKKIDFIWTILNKELGLYLQPTENALSSSSQTLDKYELISVGQQVEATNHTSLWDFSLNSDEFAMEANPFERDIPTIDDPYRLREHEERLEALANAARDLHKDLQQDRPQVPPALKRDFKRYFDAASLPADKVNPRELDRIARPIIAALDDDDT